MAFARASMLCGLAAVMGCSKPSTEPAAHGSEQPIAAAKDTPVPDSSPETNAIEPTSLEALALACDGHTLMKIGTAAIASSDARDTEHSARLLALWEKTRAFSDGHITPESADTFASAVASTIDAAPPTWWVDTLKSARGGEEGTTSYDLQVEPKRDRRGPIAPGPGGVLVRPSSGVVESGGMLAYDLSMGRIDLMPIPEKRGGTAIEVARAHSGATLYVAAFEPGRGGFRFPLRAIGSDGEERWETEVCAADRTVLSGLGAMIVEVVVLQDRPADPRTKSLPKVHGIAVFTAESHGVTLEVFDLDGRRMLAWSSDLWWWRGAT